ncbi:hypothetical protein J7M07_08820 [bacterium]|nr:hypothetical protein [bacterium]
MRKFFEVTLAVIMIAALAVPVMATNSRLEALGDVGNYIEDDANIFNWPATLPSYANIVLVDLMYHHDAMYGFIYGLGEYGDYGTIGLFFMESTRGPNDIWDNVSAPGYWKDYDCYDYSLYNKYDLVYAYEMDKMTLGLRFSRASELSSYDDPVDTNDEEDSYAYTTIGASVRMDINDDMYADLGFDYTMVSYTDENTGYGDITDDAGMKMDFNARLFYDYNETITLVPYVGFGMAEYNLKADSAAAYFGGDLMSGVKAMNFTLGIAADFKVNEDNMLVFGIEPFRYMKAEPSEYATGVTGSWEGSIVTMPRFLLALETDVKDWLTVRTGCTKSLNKMKSTTNDGTDDYIEEETEAPFNWHLGLAFHVSDFDIDCVLTDEAPFEMGYWLTGKEADSDVITRISAVYHF